MPFHVYEGSGAPGFTPRAAGLHYTNYANGDIYLSNGYASPANWVLIGSSAAITAAIATHAALVSSVHGITAAAATVLDEATVAAMVDTLFGASSSGTGGAARVNGPTFTAPVLGVASATSVVTADGSSSNAAVGVGAVDTGLYRALSQLAFVQAGSVRQYFNTGGVTIFQDSEIWAGAGNTRLTFGVNTIQQQNGANAQSLSVYNVAGTDYERGVIDWQTTADVFRVGTEKGGAGTGLPMILIADSTELFRVDVSSKISFFGATTVVKQTSGANLTNNVTSGGTSDQIDDFTNLTVYATDAAAIRNAIYQLSRKVKQINDGLRSYGLLT